MTDYFHMYFGKNNKREDQEEVAPRKTKFTHPYSYDPFTIWEDKTVKADITVYSDRLYQWDYRKHDELCQKHFGNTGQSWAKREPKKIEAFLRDYNNRPELKLGRIMEYCNVSNGYPCWRFDYFTEMKVEE